MILLREFIVPAEVDAVWHVLTDRDRYPKWIAVEGDMRAGSHIVYTMQRGGGQILRIRFRIDRLDKPHTFRLRGGVPGLLRLTETIRLEPTPAGARVIHDVTCTGFLALVGRDRILQNLTTSTAAFDVWLRAQFTSLGRERQARRKKGR